MSTNVGAAGGRIIIPPYPAANELSGIYRTKFARGVDTREVQSRFDNSRPLVADSTSFATIFALAIGEGTRRRITNPPQISNPPHDGYS